MKKITKATGLFLLFSIFSTGFTLAHALYIDTDTQGKLATAHQVKIYYSEFADRTSEKINDWYSDVAKFELWLVKPNGKKVKLETTAKEDHFLASFTPEKEGIYRVEINHTAEDPADGTAYQFNAFAHVSVESTTTAPPHNTLKNALALIEEPSSLENTKTKTFKTYLDGKPKGDILATLFLPSGDKKEVKSNAEGLLEIDLEEEGIHFLEATIYQKEEAGKTKKGAYQSLWRCATQKIEI